jgi:hypothetical protein
MLTRTRGLLPCVPVVAMILNQGLLAVAIAPRALVAVMADLVAALRLSAQVLARVLLLPLMLAPLAATVQLLLAVASSARQHRVRQPAITCASMAVRWIALAV